MSEQAAMHAAGHDDGGGHDPDVARAEALVDRWSHRVADVAQRAMARTVEEAEDLWAEAKHVRDRMGTPAEQR